MLNDLTFNLINKIRDKIEKVCVAQKYFWRLAFLGFN